MEELLKIPYAVFNNWDLLVKFLERRDNPRYELLGDIDLSNRKDIIDLGNLIRVDGKLDLFESSIQSLGNLEYVGSNLDLRYTPVKSLDNLEYVGGYLYLYNTQIQSLGNLEHVGGTIYLSGNHEIPEEEINKFKYQIEYH